LLSIDSLLPDQVLDQKLARLSDEEAATLGQEIERALHLIETADPVLLQKISSSIHWYFPIQTPDSRRVHNSLTVSILHGAIFLSQHYSYLPLAEALVHEYYHNELWILMTANKYIQMPDPPRFYSPWRLDPRPLMGLYHAIYVFTGLLKFYALADANPELGKYRSHFQSRLPAIYFQLRTGGAQVDPEGLEERGRQLFKAMIGILNEYGERLGLSATPVPPQQMNHWSEWRMRNPEIARCAISPEDSEDLLRVQQILA
jgi:HEXXH motif-containing protein